MARMLGRCRDNAAWFLASGALHLATPRYRKMIDGAIRYGLAAAAMDAQLRPEGESLTARFRATTTVTSVTRSRKEADD